MKSELTQTAWKVLIKNSRGELMSSTYMNGNSYALVYRKGRIIQSKVGNLFVFNSLSSAIRFTESFTHNSTEIWQVKTSSLMFRLSKRLSISWLDAFHIQKFWRLIDEDADIDEDTLSLEEIPMGGCVCKKLRLVSKFEQKNNL